MSRSPIRTTTPPRSAGSTAVVEVDAAAGDALEAGSRSRVTSSWLERRGARGGGVGQSLRWSSSRANSAATARQLLDPAAPDEEQDEVADRLR